ncbi:MAG: hypothetical protein R2795_13610 [Saprospiraceae bacterium]
MEILEIQSGKYKYLLRTQKGQFYISDLIYHIIHLVKDKKSNEEIAQLLNADDNWEITISIEDIEQLKAGKLVQLGVLNETGELQLSMGDRESTRTLSDGRGKYLLFKKDILRADTIHKVTQHLTWLFNPVYFWWILGIGIAVNIFLGYFSYASIVEENGLKSIITGNVVNWSYLLIYYPAAIAVLLLHEMGHATPAYMYKAPPDSIGFGLYLAFPVFYADVSKTWQLSPSQRLIVNAGGFIFK